MPEAFAVAGLAAEAAEAVFALEAVAFPVMLPWTPPAVLVFEALALAGLAGVGS